MIRASLLLCLAIAAPPAMAQSFPVPPQSERTAMWYIGHPSALKVVLIACRNDPGHAKTNPDCENVTQAEFILSANQASASVDMTPPSNPRYWRIHPEELAQKLFYCGLAKDPVTRRAIFCDSAEAAEKMR